MWKPRIPETRRPEIRAGEQVLRPRAESPEGSEERIAPPAMLAAEYCKKDRRVNLDLAGTPTPSPANWPTMGSGGKRPWVSDLSNGRNDHHPQPSTFRATMSTASSVFSMTPSCSVSIRARTALPSSSRCFVVNWLLGP